MSEIEIKQIAEEAAERAVEKTLLRLGVDPSIPEDFTAVKEDLAYLRRLRLGSEIFKKQGIATLAKIVTTAVVTAIVMFLLRHTDWPRW